METIMWIILAGIIVFAAKLTYDVFWRGPDPKGDPTPEEFRSVPTVARRRDEN